MTKEEDDWLKSRKEREDVLEINEWLGDVEAVRHHWCQNRPESAEDLNKVSV
jgi:hypothetical protein